MITSKQNKIGLIIFGLLTSIMFVIVILIVNPLIDGKTGSEVLKLQISFSTEIGRTIIEKWGVVGQQNFLKYIYTDYIYAISYSFFISNIYLYKLLISKIKIESRHKLILALPFIAGLFDIIENTIEIMFIKSPNLFPEMLFLFHSVIATLKWIGLPVILYFLLKPINK